MISPNTPSIVPVRLAGRSYDVAIGVDLLDEAGERLAPQLAGRRFVVITDATVAGLDHLPRLTAALRAPVAQTIVVEPGEASKSFAGLERLCDALLAREVDRGDVLVALGGGVVGDLVGFAAAILKRGIDFIQVPTTLLAQVDSSVGGKTAINASAGKNLIGAFHQPVAVLADVSTLATLPQREIAAGFAEIVKIALALDAEFFAWLERHGAAAVAGDRRLLVEAVRRAVELKAGVVARDERETSERALLNLGHTFGHAFEAEAGYGSGLRHGEAVGVGLVLACAYAERIGRELGDASARVRALLDAAGAPASIGALEGGPFDAERLVARKRNDKKSRGGSIRLVLPTAVGSADVFDETDEARLTAFLNAQMT